VSDCVSCSCGCCCCWYRCYSSHRYVCRPRPPLLPPPPLLLLLPAPDLYLTELAADVNVFVRHRMGVLIQTMSATIVINTTLMSLLKVEDTEQQQGQEMQIEVAEMDKG
jgi:hypothetical protein